MARNRTLSSDFWTREDVIDCSAMSRLLLLGLGNFADDFGVQALRPRTIRLQVFPGDDLDDARMRAMIDELVAHRLVRLYAVEGVEYLAIADWGSITASASARGGCPRDPALPPEPVPALVPAPQPVVVAAAPPARADALARAVGRSLRHFLPHSGPPGDTEAWIERWIADGCDLHSRRAAGDQRRLPAIARPQRTARSGRGGGLCRANRVRRLAVASD